MSTKAAGNFAKCGLSQANTRLTHARKFFEVAELVASEGETVPASASVAAALAVLAGFASRRSLLRRAGSSITWGESFSPSA